MGLCPILRALWGSSALTPTPTMPDRREEVRVWGLEYFLYFFSFLMKNNFIEAKPGDDFVGAVPSLG